MRQQPLVVQAGPSPLATAFTKLSSDLITADPSKAAATAAQSRKYDAEAAKSEAQLRAMNAVQGKMASIFQQYTADGRQVKPWTNPDTGQLIPNTDTSVPLEPATAVRDRFAASMPDITSLYAQLSDDPAKGLTEGLRVGEMYRGTPDSTRLGAMLGGDMPGTDFSGTTAEADRIAARNTSLDQNKQIAVNNAKPMREATPRNYITLEGKQSYTLDGMTDAATGARIPYGSQIFTGQVNSENAGGLKMPSSVVSNTINQVDAAETTLRTTKRLREVLKPQNMGTVGKGRALAQGVAGQVDAAAQALRDSNDSYAKLVKQDSSMVAEAGREGEKFNYGEWFDPSIPKQRYLESEVAFQIARQRSPDGRVSNDDMKRASADLQARGWLNDENSMVAVLDEIDIGANDILKQQKPRLPGNAGGAVENIPTGGSINAPAGMAQPKSEAEWQALAPGTMFLAPDGSQRVK
jgi:hypothetical protein